MKRYIAVLLLVLLIWIGSTPVQASAPTYENWEFFSARDHATYGYYTINTTNLQVQSFTVVNNTIYPTYIYIVYDETDIIFEIYASAGETITEPISNFKFRRIPATDPDDPNSIRYPNKIAIFARNG